MTFQEWKQTLDPNDAKLYGTAGVIGVLSIGALGLFSHAARQKATVEFVEQPPHDLWSFLGSKQGTLLITSTMKLATAIVSR